jgi:uncharacterized membrane protein YdjX (TVP38/TMEM64 family)
MSGSETRAETGAGGQGGWWKLVLAVGVVTVGVVAAWWMGLFEYLTLDNIDRIGAWFEGLGIWAPIVFVGAWIAACVFFLPGLPITIVGALIFGPIWGSVYSIIGSTLGATAAFLVGRYAARDMVEGLVQKNQALARIDDGVRRQGWRMLMITRLVPVFPFNAQNYVYGLTKISLITYVVVSFICMLPACIAFNFAAGSVRTGNFGRFLLYLGGAAVLFVLLSFLPGWIRKRYGDAAAVEDAPADETRPRPADSR